MQKENKRKPYLRRAAAAALAALLLLSGAAAQTRAPDDVLGTAATRYTGVGERGSRATETSLGNAAADAAREAAGADFAVIPGGLICNNIIAGDVTWRELTLVLPDDADLATASVSARQLRQLLEQCVASVVTDDSQTIDYEASQSDAYPQISGFTLRYDVSRPVGERVVYIKNPDGEELDLDDGTARYVLVSTAQLLGGEYGTDALDHAQTGTTLREAMADFIGRDGLTGEETGRVKVAGSSDNTLLGGFPIELAALTIIFLILAFRIFYHPKPSFANGFKMPPKGERFDDMAQPEQDGEGETKGESK